LPTCPLIKEHHNVALIYWDNLVFSLATFYVAQLGLSNWGARTPRYGTNFYGIYNRARILRVDYDYQVTSSTSAPFCATLAALQYSAAAPSADEIAQARNAVTHTSGGLGSLNIINIRKSFSPDVVGGTLGQTDNLSWYKLSEQNAAPKDLSAPVTWFVARTLDGTVASFYVQEKITYHMRYFGLVNSAAPTLGLEMVEESSESEEYVPSVLSERQCIQAKDVIRTESQIRHDLKGLPSRMKK